jgi:hypothetical protein
MDERKMRAFLEGPLSIIPVDQPIIPPINKEWEKVGFESL